MMFLYVNHKAIQIVCFLVIRGVFPIGCLSGFELGTNKLQWGYPGCGQCPDFDTRLRICNFVNKILGRRRRKFLQSSIGLF